MAEKKIIAIVGATGTVSGYTLVGGLCAVNAGTISECYSTGIVRSIGFFPEFFGGLCGLNQDTISDCFWDIQTSGQATSAGGMGKTTAEMMTLSTFTDAGWDFSDTDGDGADWRMITNYPYLTWEKLPYSGGTGTAADPFHIRTVDDWLTLTHDTRNWHSHFILDSDIDLGGTVVTSIGINSEMIYFRGIFDGSGHVIRNGVIDGPGLFSLVDRGGQIRYLGLEDITVVTIKEYAGGLCGYNRGTIKQCYVTGIVHGEIQGGGLCGLNDGTISDCYSMSRVFGSYSIQQYLGGLCGENLGTIHNCYATGAFVNRRVDDSVLVGGLCGVNSATISGSFWDTQTSGRTASAGGTGKTTAEMKTLTPFTDAGWDFENVWGIDENKSYPTLRVFPKPDTKASADLNGDGRVDLADFALFAGQWMK